MNLGQILLFFSIHTLVICQNTWGTSSSASIEGLNSLDFNPAALGIKNGKIDGIFLKPDLSGKFTKSSSLHFATLDDGFSLSYGINNGTKLFKSRTYENIKLGYGSKIYEDLYCGLSVDNSKNITSGILYRPNSYISIGYVEKYSSYNELNELLFGLALRPLSNHRLTLGFDFNYFDDKNIDNSINPFIEFYPTDGIKISAKKKTILNEDFVTLNLSFVLSDKVEIFTSTINSNSYTSNRTGIGLLTSENKKKSIINKYFKKNLNLVKIDLNGTFIEEPPKANSFLNFSLDFGIFNIGNNNKPGIQLRTWIDQVNAIAKNPNIDGIVLKLGQVNAGLSKKQEIRNALMNVKNSGKKIYAYCEGDVSNTGYYLISMADEIYIHSQNSIYLTGLSANFMFYKKFLEKLEVSPIVYRVQDENGKSYKGAVDMFINDSITPEMKEEYNKILDDFYYVFVRDISEGRNWSFEETENVIDKGPFLIANDAVSVGLLTSTMYPDQFKSYIDNLNDGKVEISKFNPNPTYDYGLSWKDSEKPNIALIYAVGGIQSGVSNPGPRGSTVMGDKTISKAFKDAHSDKEIDAIILRIDSGGGSAIASDMMWRQFNLSRSDSANKKPFIVSMSDIAASGGYYIATEADKIIANETTITGSIGVISFWPNFSKLMTKYGISFDDYSITKGKHSNFKYLNIANRLHSDYEKEKIQGSLNNVYYEFKTRVIDGRPNLSDIDELDNIALGRIWTGPGAKNVFLVDEVGGLGKAYSTAKEMLGYDTKSKINIIEYPKIYSNNFSFDKISDEQDLKIGTNLLPENFNNPSFLIDVLPIIYSDDMLMLMPYDINID